MRLSSNRYGGSLILKMKAIVLYHLTASSMPIV